MRDLLTGASSLNINLTGQQEQKFVEYYSLLLEWNQKYNLTAITDKKEVAIKHFLDSLTCSFILNDYLKSSGLTIDACSLLDVGSGAGFPGVPLKIYYPELAITLLDSLGKRTIFLNEAIAQLGLQKITAVHARAEETARKTNWREQYQFVVSRAVAKLNVLTEYCLPFVQVRGIFIAMKGPDYQQELNDSYKAIELLGGKLQKVQKIALPVINNERNLIVIEKVKNTPLKYPRNSGQINKKSL